jgi:hypothetical protein
VCRGSLDHLSADPSSEINRLKTQLRRAQEEISDWQRFARNAFAQIGHQVHFTGDFPVDDGEAQRFILADLLQKLESVRRDDALELTGGHNLAAENERLKEKLRHLKQKCDSMLGIIHEQGYDGRYRTYRTPPPRSSKLALDEVDRIGTHVKELTGVTRKIKRSHTANQRCGSGDLDW